MTATIFLLDFRRARVAELDGASEPRSVPVACPAAPEIAAVGAGYALAALGTPPPAPADPGLRAR